jgi:hypothetical protein
LSVRYDLRLEAIDPVFPGEVSPGFLERGGRPSPLLDRGVDDKSVGPVIGASDKKRLLPQIGYIFRDKPVMNRKCQFMEMLVQRRGLGSKWAAIWSIGFADRSQCRNKKRLPFARITGLLPRVGTVI